MPWIAAAMEIARSMKEAADGLANINSNIVALAEAAGQSSITATESLEMATELAGATAQA